MKEYLLFDLDGTLTDPKVGITTCVQYALKSFGIEEQDLDKLESFIGPPLKDSFMQFYGLSGEQADKAVEKYRERFQDTGLFENEVYEGIPQMLANLKRKGVHLAVASSKPTVFVERILEHFEMKDFFEVIVGSELDGRRVNKDEVVAEVLHQLFGTEQIACDKVYMIGDRKFDVEGARALGVESIGVSYGYGSLEELKEAGADYIVQSVSELNYVLLREFREVEPSGSIQLGIPLLGAAVLYLLTAVFATNVFFIVTTGVLLIPWAAKLIEHSRYDMYVAHVRRDLPVAYLVAVFTGYAMLLGAHLLMDLTGNIEIPGVNPVVEEYMTTAVIWKKLLCVGVLVPAVEELFFRGILYNVFRFKFRLPLAMCFSALLYAILQVGLERTPYLVVLGFALAYMYEYFGSFFVPLLVHIACSILWVLMSSFEVCREGLHIWPICIILFLAASIGMGILNKEKKII